MKPVLCMGGLCGRKGGTPAVWVEPQGRRKGHWLCPSCGRRPRGEQPEYSKMRKEGWPELPLDT